MPADSTHPLATKRLVIGHLTVCKGCCCGNTENGRPLVPVDWLKKEWRARGLLKRVQLTISGCLGPCDLPNVVTVSNENGTQWFEEITEFAQYRDLVDWATRSRDAGELLALPKVSSLSDNLFQSFQVAIRLANNTGRIGCRAIPGVTHSWDLPGWPDGPARNLRTTRLPKGQES